MGHELYLSEAKIEKYSFIKDKMCLLFKRTKVPNSINTILI